MAWSEQIGGTIILPSDVDPDNPDRNYVMIGEDIPPEIANEISAGIVFHKAIQDPGTTDVHYYVLGINTDGALVMSVYWQEVVGIDPGPPQEIFYAYHMTDMFTLVKGAGFDDFPRMILGALGGVSVVSGMTLYDVVTHVMATYVHKPIYWSADGRTGYPGAFQPGWSRYSLANPGITNWQDLRFYRMPDGMIKAQGLFQYTGAAGATQIIYNVPADLRMPADINPQTGMRGFIFTGAVNDAARAFAYNSTHQLSLRGALPAAGAYVSWDVEWPGPEWNGPNLTLLP